MKLSFLADLLRWEKRRDKNSWLHFGAHHGPIMYLNTETFCGLKVGFRHISLPVLQDLRKRGSIGEFVHLRFGEIGHLSIPWNCLRTHSIEPLLGSQTIIVNPLHIFAGTDLGVGDHVIFHSYISYIFESPLPRCYASKNDALSLNLCGPEGTTLEQLVANPLIHDDAVIIH